MEIAGWDASANGFPKLGHGGANGDGGCRGVEVFRCGAEIPLSPSALPSSSPGVADSCILHQVSMKDTLAGVAIKYGVEVADIKRLNGFSTDIQMFAHKAIRIPCTGRHPPSHQANGLLEDRDHSSQRRPHRILGTLNSLKPPRHKVTAAMSLLHGYYGLGTINKSDITSEGTEMALYRKGNSTFFDNEPHVMDLPNSETISNRHRKSISLIGSLPTENSEVISDRMTSDNSDTEGSVRRRQKADTSPELLPRRESSGSFSVSAGKGLALRPKSGSRADLNNSQHNLLSVGGDSTISEGLQSVKKSSSTSNLQESDSAMPSFMLPGRLAPLFEGIPNPIASWRNKAARD